MLRAELAHSKSGRKLPSVPISRVLQFDTRAPLCVLGSLEVGRPARDELIVGGRAHR